LIASDALAAPRESPKCGEPREAQAGVPAFSSKPTDDA